MPIGYSPRRSAIRHSVRVLGAPILIVTGPSGVGKSTVSGLVAATLDESVHVRMDDFMRFAVNGWVEPWRPEAAHQNRVLGGAVVAAAMEFAQGGFAVVIEGTVFPDSLKELALAFDHRRVPLHYVVLRCDLRICLERATRRDPGGHLDQARFAQLHAKFDKLDEHGRHVVEAAGTPDEVASAVLAAFQSGRLDANASQRP